MYEHEVGANAYGVKKLRPQATFLHLSVRPLCQFSSELAPDVQLEAKEIGAGLAFLRHNAVA